MSEPAASSSAASTPLAGTLAADTSVATNRLGVVLALTAEAMFFLGVFGVTLVLRSGGVDPPSLPRLPGGGWLLGCALLAMIANSGPLSLRERVRVISSEESVPPAPDHPDPLPQEEGTRRTTSRAAWAAVVVLATLFLIRTRDALHWPANPSPLPCAVTVLAWALAMHVLVSLLCTLGELITPRPVPLVPLWFFALGIWAAERLLL